MYVRFNVDVHVHLHVHGHVLMDMVRHDGHNS